MVNHPDFAATAEIRSLDAIVLPLASRGDGRVSTSATSAPWLLLLF
jgi:hypothetical protein